MLTTIKKHKTEPRSILDAFFNDDFFSGFYNTRTNHSNETLPAVNIEESEKSFSIDVAAPGLDKKDFHITVDQNKLTISSSNKEEKKEVNETFLRREFNYKAFSRTFTLPKNTDTSKIKASHKNGVLSVNIPKVEAEVKKALEIKIN
jgi:HSP20 family protein